MSGININGACSVVPLRPANSGGATSGAAGTATPLDSARADRVKAAISSGNYPVDANKLAERLMALGLFQGDK